MPKIESKPRGRMSAYSYFAKCCSEEHKKKHPGENIVFAEFTKKCAEKWKEMTPKEKRRFEEMAEKDKARYEREMANYTPAGGPPRGKKRTKDPNAPKRPLSAFFLFANEERPKVRAEHPEYMVGDVGKELGKRWKVVDHTRFDRMAEQEKQRYQVAMEAYKASQAAPAKKSKSPAKKQRVEESEEDDDDDDEEDDDDDDDDDE